MRGGNAAGHEIQNKHREWQKRNIFWEDVEVLRQGRMGCAQGGKHRRCDYTYCY